MMLAASTGATLPLLLTSQRVEQDMSECAAPETAWASAISFCESYRQAWNAREPDRLLALTHPDVVWEDPTIPSGVARGHAEARRWLSSLWRAFPDLVFSFADSKTNSPADGILLSQDGSRIAAAWDCEGTHSRQIHRLGWKLPRGQIRLRGVDIYSIEGGLARRIQTTADMMMAARQLGALPPRGSMMERLMMLAGGLSVVFGRLGKRSPAR
jgi:hypothetical protein